MNKIAFCVSLLLCIAMVCVALDNEVVHYFIVKHINLIVGTRVLAILLALFFGVMSLMFISNQVFLDDRKDVLFEIVAKLHLLDPKEGLQFYQKLARMGMFPSGVLAGLENSSRMQDERSSWRNTETLSLDDDDDDSLV